MEQKNESIEKLRKIIKAVRQRKPFYRPAEVEREIHQKLIVARSKKRRDYEDRHMASSPELTYTEIQQIEKECRDREWKAAGIKMTLAALGLAAVVGGGAKALSSGESHKEQPKVAIEQVEENGEEAFKESLKFEEKETDSKEPDLSPEEKAAMEADAVINAIVNAYNEKYDTQVSSENVKVLQTNPIYVSRGKDGSYVLDEWRYWDVAELDVGSGTVYTLIDGKTNEILYSAIRSGHETFDCNTHIIKSWKNEEFVNHHEQGDFLKASDISFDKTIQGDKTAEELAFDAIGNKIERVLNQDKAKDQGER